MAAKHTLLVDRHQHHGNHHSNSCSDVEQPNASRELFDKASVFQGAPITGSQRVSLCPESLHEGAVGRRGRVVLESLFVGFEEGEQRHEVMRSLIHLDQGLCHEVELQA